MSIAVGNDGLTWLQQDGAESPADTLPDVTGDFSIFLWFNNLSPAIVLPAYKVALVLFTTADLANPSYTDPYALVSLQQVDGAQAVGFTVGTGAGTATPFVTSGIEKRAVLLTYNHTTKVWTFSIRRLAAWETVGTVTYDISGSAITQMRLLNDGLASIGSMSVTYFRLWNGKTLTLDEAEDEATSAVAITAGVTTDTPLVTVDDLTDVASASGSQWYAKP